MITDGPYILLKEDVAEVYTIVQQQWPKRIEIVRDELSLTDVSSHMFTCSIDNYKDICDFESFQFQIDPLNRLSDPPPYKYEQPEKVLVMSDIEGNFYALQSMLLAQGAIDINCNWTFGKNHLVMLGDLIDRCYNVLPCLWLIYKLEMQAREYGGVVHFILGNHELMNFEGDYRYLHHKYKSPQKVHYLYNSLFARGSFLGDWIRTKNTVEVIGDRLFVHGGISKLLVEEHFTIDQINNLVRNNLEEKNSEPDERVSLLLSSHGPLWYRGMVMKGEDREPLTKEDVATFAVSFNVEKFVVGHSVVPVFTKFYNGRLIAIDIVQPSQKGKKVVQALLIEGSDEFMVDDEGGRTSAFRIV